MKIKDLLERSGVQLLSGGCGEEEITALTYDSRKAQTGSLFFCLRGARSNGEDFAPAAYAQGCRCFVSEGTLDVPEDADVSLDNPEIYRDLDTEADELPLFIGEELPA